MALTKDHMDELDALAKTNDATGKASFLMNHHRAFYQPMEDAGLVRLGPPPGDFDPKLFFGATITDAGRAALSGPTSETPA